MLDIDAPDKKDAMYAVAARLAKRLVDMWGAPVAVYDSGRGYWLVLLRRLAPKDWETVYRWAQLQGSPFDQIHIEASLKWHRTTLRVSPKNGENDIKLVALYTSTGGLAR
jgi:hypothetical protein